MEANRAMDMRQLGRIDRLGASLSFLCALHCLLQPLLLLALPMVGLGFFLNENLETLFLTLTVILASFALLLGYRHHRNARVFPLLGGGIIFIVASRLPFLESLEMPLAVAGALLITSSHVINLRARKRLSHAPASSEIASS
jgi:hypothetical protein